MQGSPKMIIRIIHNEDKIYIPLYQRRYSWGTDQVQRLVEDILMAEQRGLDKYFIGSLILDLTTTDAVAVIDGQQRLTTISLFLIALRDLMAVTDERQARIINDKYLVDPYDEETVYHNRLKPVDGDEQQYIDVLLHGDQAKPSLFKLNYQYFKNAVQSGVLSVEDWLNLLQMKLQAMVITVQPGDDAQLIFESLNSTGLGLTESDKIRNYLLMGLERDAQTQAFEVWKSIERLVHRENISNFYRHYLTSLATSSKPVKKNDIYDNYRQEIGLHPNFDRYSELLEEEKVAKIYAKIQFPQEYQFTDQTTQRLLIRLSHLHMDVMMPYFLQIFDLYEKQKLSLNGLNEVLQTVLGYLARRLFVGIPSTGLNNFFTTLNRQVQRLTKNNDINYPRALEVVLTHKVKENKIFPSNAMIMDALTSKDYYHIRTESFWFIMDELNNWRGETQMLFERAENGDFSIEHILPQTLSRSWQQNLGQNWHDIQVTWINRLANLTLTGFNSQMSNHSFRDKRDAPNGYRDSGIKLNQTLVGMDEWNESSLKQRQSDLYQRALKVWPLPSVVDVEIDAGEWVSLADIDPKGEKPITFSFKEQRDVSIKSWKELYDRIVNILWLDNPPIFYKLANDDAEWLVKYNHEVSDSIQYRQLDNADQHQGLSVYSGGASAQDRKRHIQRFLTASNDSLENVQVKLNRGGSFA
ncbi:DUF262 domain-containing protein [Levilactobacillus acidifarinae]|nr:DUF262 domain-containing protein [Levilactobacillus acidifarinae]GEO68571.1 hypothetical protein LAC03_04810 [Levilactobacillus acidifarinae]